MTRIVKIPARFYQDHCDRALPAPEPVKASRSNFWIDMDDPDFGELEADAQFYAHPHGPDGAPHIVRAAKAMLAAIAKRAGGAA